MEIVVRGGLPDYPVETLAAALFGKNLEEVAKDFIREERTKSAKREGLSLHRPHEDG